MATPVTARISGETILDIGAGSERVSIIVPTVNAPILKVCLEAISRHSKPGYELIIVADEPDEDRIKLLNQLIKDNTHIIINPHKVGIPRAINQGIAISTMEYIMVMNDDCLVLSDDWLGPLVSALQKHKEFGCAFPTLPPNTYPGQNRRSTVLFECSLLSRELVNRVGKLDESDDFSHLCCDYDYHWRVVQFGYKPTGIKESVVTHVMGQTILKTLTKDKMIAPMRRLMAKHGKAAVDYSLIPYFSVEEDKYLDGR